MRYKRIATLVIALAAVVLALMASASATRADSSEDAAKYVDDFIEKVLPRDLSHMNIKEFYSAVNNVWEIYNSQVEPKDHDKIKNIAKLQEAYGIITAPGGGNLYSGDEEKQGSLADGFAFGKKHLGLIFDIPAAIVSALGTIILMWGFFEWGVAMQSSDPSGMPQAWNRIGAGVLLAITPSVITAIFG